MSETVRTPRELEPMIFPLMQGNKPRLHEARQWLVNGLADVPLGSTASQHLVSLLFPKQLQDFLASRPRGEEDDKTDVIVEAALSVVVEQEPAWMGDQLTRFTSWNDRIATYIHCHAHLWFDSDQHGSNALMQFAFQNRAEVWDLLVWRGRHSQAPSQVAQRPDYWLEVDVPASVDVLLKHKCRLFLRSPELRETIQDPSFIKLDRAFWSRVCGHDCQSIVGPQYVTSFLTKWYGAERNCYNCYMQELTEWLFLHDYTEAVDHERQSFWRAFRTALASVRWRPLCHRLLPLLDTSQIRDLAAQTFWQECEASSPDLVTGVCWKQTSDLILAAALSYRPQSLLMACREAQEEGLPGARSCQRKLMDAQEMDRANLLEAQEWVLHHSGVESRRFFLVALFAARSAMHDKKPKELKRLLSSASMLRIRDDCLGRRPSKRTKREQADGPLWQVKWSTTGRKDTIRPEAAADFILEQASRQFALSVSKAKPVVFC